MCRMVKQKFQTVNSTAKFKKGKTLNTDKVKRYLSTEQVKNNCLHCNKVFFLTPILEHICFH